MFDKVGLESLDSVQCKIFASGTLSQWNRDMSHINMHYFLYYKYVFWHPELSTICAGGPSFCGGFRQLSCGLWICEAVTEEVVWLSEMFCHMLFKTEPN